MSAPTGGWIRACLGRTLPRLGLVCLACDQQRTSDTQWRGVNVPNKDEAEGRVKEAAGDLTADEDLQREGKVDQAAGKAKEAVDDAGDKVKDALDRD